MSFEIYTDTASNLGKKDANKYNLHLIHLPYFVNGKECTYTDLDSFDDKLYYYGLKNGIEVKTSQINPEKYIESFKKQLDEGKDILFIGLSSGVLSILPELQRKNLHSSILTEKLCFLTRSAPLWV